MMNQNNLIDVIIPVAGKGERFYPHTKYTQKCLLPVGDKPILGHILSKINSVNMSRIIYKVRNRCIVEKSCLNTSIF